ncbi:MAG: hypothetical protein EZS28_015930 [Streblomastix strix]|uniref:Uncharacterized protein n=1 Tax=Streblomastix strix TaxID=222440 RepID=A0A5J4W252_9EUKA|nr:MAG: hypothetical protein EZS28_015930 [Streblomastix strix]
MTFNVQISLNDDETPKLHLINDQSQNIDIDHTLTYSIFASYFLEFTSNTADIYFNKLFLNQPIVLMGSIGQIGQTFYNKAPFDSVYFHWYPLEIMFGFSDEPIVLIIPSTAQDIRRRCSLSRDQNVFEIVAKVKQRGHIIQNDLGQAAGIEIGMIEPHIFEIMNIIGPIDGLNQTQLIENLEQQQVNGQQSINTSNIDQ